MPDAHKNRADALLCPQHHANLFIAVFERGRRTGICCQFSKHSNQTAFGHTDAGLVQLNRQMRCDTAASRMGEALHVKKNCAKLVPQGPDHLHYCRAFTET